MKRVAVRLFATVILAGATANSQAPSAAASLLSQLQAVQAANKVLIDQQQKTLQMLDEMKATAEQLKTFGKRG